MNPGESAYHPSEPVVLPLTHHDDDREYHPPAVDPPLKIVDTKKKTGRRKINIEFIEDKSRRHITFSKRKAGIMKKAYELSTLTGTQVLLLVASETGHVYTFATPKLQPLITKPDGKNLIQACLNAPDTLTQAPPSTGSNLSPTGYSQPEHISQNEYASQPSPHSPYASEEKPLPYLQRSYGDVKPFQSMQIQPGSPLQHEQQPHSPYASPYPTSHPQLMGNRGPYTPSTSSHGGPSLPTLTERGSFSNLPNNLPSYPQFASQPLPSHFTNSPMGNNGPFPSSPFPSHSFPSTMPQLFKAPSNLPQQRDE